MSENVGNAAKWKAFGNRLRMIREDLYGEKGSHHLAKALNIPHHTWLNYESGTVVPADVVLQLQVLYGVNAGWLLTGEGEKYDRSSPESEASFRLN